jgi:hypothetical protein
MTARIAAVMVLAALGLAACGAPPAPVASVPPPRPPAPATPDLGPVLGPDGRCTGEASPSVAAAITPGISECDLVRLKGKPATDVLVGESGKGQREVQVLYSEPGGRELYFFVNNRLDRVVKP